MKYLILDTETTGLESSDELLEIAVIDNTGRILLHTYLTPIHHKEWDAVAIHGITPEFIFNGNFPTYEQIKEQLYAICKGNEVVIYSASFDTMFVGHELRDSTVYCAMLAFAEYYGDWNSYWGNYTWQKLTTAAAYVLHEWQYDQHSALGDCLASLDVWEYLNNPEKQAQVKEIERIKAEEEQANWFGASLYWREKRGFEEKAKKANELLTQQIYKAANITTYGYKHVDRSRESADAFMIHLTGYSLKAWDDYGERLNLPRVKEIPEGYRTIEGIWTFLDKTIKTTLMLEKRCRSKHTPNLTPLYDFSNLEIGVHYLPSLRTWPENAYSATHLKKTFKLKDAQIQELKCVGVVTHSFGYYYVYEFIKANEAITT